MNSEPNKVSVCIATYNGEKYIKDQLDSILNQIKFNDEIIISDDHSTDNTIKIIEKYNDTRIKIFINNQSGVINNFENAIKKSTGDYIFLSDQDDIWKPNKVDKILNYHSKGYNLVIHNGEIFDDETKVISNNFFDLYKSKTGLIKNLLSNSYIGCCISFDKKVRNRILPFPSKIPMHDSWIGLIAEKYFKVIFIDDVLIEYRHHSKNVSFTATGKSKINFLRKIKFRYLILKSLYFKI